MSYVVVIVYSALFIRSLWMKNVLYSEVNFFLAISLSVFSYGVGWWHLKNMNDSSEEPYSFIRYVHFRQQVRIIRTLTFMSITQLTYLNFTLLTLIMLLATDEFHYIGILAPFGYYFMHQVRSIFLEKKREEIHKATYGDRPPSINTVNLVQTTNDNESSN